jgi:hypothetical protein
MADVEYQFTTTERKVRKSKKTTSSNKRRESNDQGDVTITELDKENVYPLENGHEDKRYFPKARWLKYDNT